MAEIEIGVLARQCLDRRIANQDILRGEVNAWQNQRNRDVIRVDWRFRGCAHQAKVTLPREPESTESTGWTNWPYHTATDSGRG